LNASAGDRTLCIVVCGAGPASRVHVLVDHAQLDGWTVRIVATPTAVTFLDAEALAEQSGSPVRSDYRTDGEPGARSSAADAVIVAPGTYNSINKLAAGINDTYALNVVAEAIGRGTPVAILPFVNAALAVRRPFQQAVESLRQEGVRVLLGPDQWQPHPPGRGDERLDDFPWHLALAAIGVAGPDARTHGPPG
jgi:phosphopantothenoylcysteine synthetase/decarboxylase